MTYRYSSGRVGKSKLRPLRTHLPADTLDFLWVLLRLRKESVGGTELAKALDDIKAAESSLEVDRRFLWLETIAVRFA